MSSKAQTKSETKTPAQPVNGSREHFEAYQAEQAAIAEAEATGSPEVVALRRLVRSAESVFEFEGYTHLGTPMTPLQILSEALRCAQSDFAVIGDAHSGSCVKIDGMVFRRAELRLDLALALAEYREEFPIGVTEETAKAAE